MRSGARSVSPLFVPYEIPPSIAASTDPRLRPKVDAETRTQDQESSSTIESPTERTTPVLLCVALQMKLEDVAERLSGKKDTLTASMFAMEIKAKQHSMYIGHIDAAIGLLAKNAAEFAMWLAECRNEKNQAASAGQVVKAPQDKLCARLEKVTSRLEKWLCKFDNKILLRPTYDLDPDKNEWSSEMQPLKEAAQVLATETSKVAVHCRILCIHMRSDVQPVTTLEWDPEGL